MTDFILRKKVKLVAMAISVLLMGGLLSACGDKPDVETEETQTPVVQNSETTTTEIKDDITEQTEASSLEVESDTVNASVDEPAQSTTATAEIVAEQAALPADAGQKRYEATCKNCHAQGLLGAPKLGDKTAWSSHLTKDIETLYDHSAHGFKKMPAQAVGDIPEAEVRAAVDYMIEKVK